MRRAKSNPYRDDKLNSKIQQILGRVLLPYIEDLPGLLTVSKVETSGDLKWTKVWLSILNGNDNEYLTILQKNIYDIQGELNRELPMKVFPRIQFYLDTSPRYAEHIDELIKQVHQEDET